MQLHNEQVFSLLLVRELLYVFFFFFFPSVLQAVHAERILGGWVGQHYVWVVKHVQPVQGQRVNL